LIRKGEKGRSTKSKSESSNFPCIKGPRKGKQAGGKDEKKSQREQDSTRRENAQRSTEITREQWKTEKAQGFVRDARESKAYSSLLDSIFAMSPKQKLPSPRLQTGGTNPSSASSKSSYLLPSLTP